MLSRGFKTIAITSFICFCFFSIASARGQEMPKIVRKSGGVLMNEAINRAEPNYPPLARAARVSGGVVVEVTTDEEGKVISARALSGHPLLKDAAVTAAEQWTFKPTRLNGVPVKVIGTITFNFVASDPSKNIEAIKEQIKLDPDSAELHHKLGLAYHFDGQSKKAVEAFNQALALKPDYADVYRSLGSAYKSLRQTEKAIEALNQALALKPGDADILIEMSRVYIDANRLDEAIEIGKQVLNSNGEDYLIEEAVSTVGLTLVRQKRYREATEFLEQSASRYPDRPVIRLYLGFAYSMAGDRDAAMKVYRDLKEKNPDMANQLLDAIDRRR